jgi:hypothetical protein
MKRVWIIVGVGFLLLLLFGWWYSQHEWLTNELLAQIKLGMKKEHVEALLGNPVDGYSVNMAMGPINYPMQISLVALVDSWLRQTDCRACHTASGGGEIKKTFRRYSMFADPERERSVR